MNKKMILAVVVMIICLIVLIVIIASNKGQQNMEQRDNETNELYNLSGYEDIFAETILKVRAKGPIDGIESVVFSDEDLINEIDQFLSELCIEKFTGTLPLITGGGRMLILSYESGDVILGFETYDDIGNIISVDNVDYLCDKDIEEIWDYIYDTAKERNGYMEF